MEQNLLKIEDISKATREHIVEILDIIIYKLELILATENTEKLDYIEMPFGYSQYDYLSGSDIKRTTEILNKFVGKDNFEFSIAVVKRNNNGKLWAKLQQELQSFRNAIQLNKPIITGEKIVEIIIIEPKQGGNRYSIVVNQQFLEPIEADRVKPSWDLLYRIAKNKELPYQENYQKSVDYFNNNRRCKLYTQTGLSLTKILSKENNYIVPTIKISVISDKAYKQKVNLEQK